MTGGPPPPPEDSRFPAWHALSSRWAFLSLVTLLYWVTSQGIRPFLPIRLERLGASDFVIGLAVAAYAVVGLLLAIPSGRLLDRLSQRGLLVGAMLGLAVTTAALPLFRSVLLLSLGMIVNGLFAMWVWLVLQSMISSTGEGRVRRNQMALFSLTWGIGLAAGPSVGAVLYDRLDFTGLCLIMGVVTLVGGLAAAAAPSVRPPGATDGDAAPEDAGIRAALARAFENPILVSVLISSFINLFVLSMRISFYPVYLERAGVTITQIGLLLSVIGISSLAVRTILPLVERRFGTLRVLIYSTWLAIIGAASIPLTTNVVVLTAGAALIGVGLGANPPITVSLLAEHSDARDRGLAVGLRMVANRSGQVAQPLVFGGLAAAFGLGLAFPVSGVLLAGMTLWMSLRLRPYR
ncbi:MFS transporter [Blastococcus saxobsidens]|uniref:Putative MFS family arabinose efflux permease n=1 Tax=Blastococcus saxobsidens TaxID=138336 RepID=A0A4Q7Y4L3_9ACTN|nr:MFS transporter [Blastococcus saxobsidens]RZU31001.1 putative MFS family arabinose efflux permease [Blastococcus saxobsidens]